jgi:hypothetical protein
VASRRIALKEAAKLAVGMENFARAVLEIEIRLVVIAGARALRSRTRRAEEAEDARRGYSTGA